MPHPEQLAPAGQRKSQLSPLMQAMAKAAGDGRKINFCPYGCQDEDTDEHGYCRHLVGFTNDGKNLEPMIVEKGRRVVRVAKPDTPLREGELDKRAPIYDKVLPTDKLVQITISSRVYRDVDAVKGKKVG